MSEKPSLPGSDKGAAKWFETGLAADFEEGKGRSFEIDSGAGRKQIAVFLHQEQWFAIDDCCTHARIALVDGMVKDGCILCPWHYAEFDLESGAALSGPATEALTTYPVRVNASGAVEVLA